MPLVLMAASGAFGFVKGYFSDDEEKPSPVATAAKAATIGLAVYGGYTVFKNATK